MPVFHFHIRRGNVLFEDKEGAELPNLTAAMSHSVEDALAIMRNEPEVPPAEQWVEIVDHEGNTIRTLPFVTVTAPAQERRVAAISE